MRLSIDTAPDGKLRVRDADTGRNLVGIFRVELVATGAHPHPELVLFLDACEHIVDVKAAHVKIDRRPRTCARFPDEE